MEKLGHVCQFTLIPTETVPSYVFWNSSPKMNGDFYINYKMFHAYCCSGILQVQYERLCEFAGIWVYQIYASVSKWHLHMAVL